MDNIETKICVKCGIEKELTNNNFAWRKDNNKWRNKCKECSAEYISQYKKDNKEKVDAVKKAHYENNKEKVLAKCKAYRDEHAEEHAARNKKYYEEHIEERLAYQKNYNIEHSIEITEYKKEYAEENKQILAEKSKKYRDEHKEEKAIADKTYRENNKEAMAEYQRKYHKERRHRDIIYKMRTYISTHILIALKANGGSKRGYSIMEFLPYTIEQLKEYIESLFEPWMTWENHGKYNRSTWNDPDPSTWTWQIDHIIPHSFFHYASMDCQTFQDCWALSNLRPYSAKQNVLDGNRRQIEKQSSEPDKEAGNNERSRT